MVQDGYNSLQDFSSRGNLEKRFQNNSGRITHEFVNKDRPLGSPNSKSQKFKSREFSDPASKINPSQSTMSTRAKDVFEL